MNKKEKIFASVVTFNRKKLLEECLNALFAQSRKLSKIIIVNNNSTDGTKEFLNKLIKKNKNFIVINLKKNIGNAGGQYVGIKRAYKEGADWVWAMDDDAIPKKEALKELMIHSKKPNISVLGGKVLEEGGEISLKHRGLFEFNNFLKNTHSSILKREYSKKTVTIDFVSFVGMLINRNAISKAGFPKKDFFIQADDAEYCIRLGKVGKIVLVPSSIIIHKEVMQKKFIQKKKFNKTFFRLPYDKFWISYYGIRNNVWIGKKYSRKKTQFYATFLSRLFKSIFMVLVLDDFKIKRIFFLLNAYFDGLKGKFDNDKPKKLLEFKKEKAKNSLKIEKEALKLR